MRASTELRDNSDSLNKSCTYVDTGPRGQRVTKEDEGKTRKSEELQVAVAEQSTHQENSARRRRRTRERS